MGEVETVLGPVPSGELGQVLMHEHVFVRSPEIEANWPTGWDPKAAVAEAVDRLQELAGAGVGTIVDLTVVGLGRDVALVREVAEQVPVHIVAATGLYTYDTLPHFFEYRTAQLRPGGIDALEEYFLHDIEEGIADTGIRPGILKCATDSQGVTPGVERVLRAVARVHRRTGLPISTHTHAETRRGLDQQRIFAEEGVDLGKVVIGHSGDSTDLEYLGALVDAGSTLGMDRFGIESFLPDPARVETVAALCRAGHADRMVLSHDAACHFDWFEPGAVQMFMPHWHWMHIHRDILPALREAGVSEQDLTTMLVDNPRRILERGDDAAD